MKTLSLRMQIPAQIKFSIYLSIYKLNMLLMCVHVVRKLN